MEMPRTILEIARAYRAAGLSVVASNHVVGHTAAGRAICSCGLAEHCTSPGKHPAGSWAARQAVPASEEDLVAWFGGEEPRHQSIGIVTGAVSGNVFVVDVDCGPGKDGDDSLRALQMRHEDLPATAEVRTGGGGRHLYFRAPAGMRIRSDKNVLGPGVDIRGEGGFVVAPPSMHVSGQPYRWDPFDHLASVGIAEAPEWLLEAVKDGAARPVDASRGAGGTQTAPAYQTAPTGSLGILPPKLVDGREAYMVSTILACLRQFIGEHGAAPSPQELYDAAWPQYDLKVDWRCRPGRGPAEFMQKCIATLRRFERGQIRGLRTLEEAVESHRARRAGAQQQASAHGFSHRQQENSRSDAGESARGDDGQAMGADAHSDGQGQEQPTSRFPLVYINEITTAEPALDFVEGLLVEGGMSVWYGDSNVGKTFAVLDLAIHVALGRPWRGREVDQGAVIYCALEGVAGIRNRVAAWLKHYGITALKPEDVPIVVIPAAINMLDAQADVPGLVEAVRIAAARLGIPVKLVVIDTLSRALAGGNENSPEDMGALVRASDYVRQAASSALAYIHHAGKDAARGARGHSLLRAATDTEIEISRPEGSEVSVIKVTKQRELEVGDEIAFRLEVIPLGFNRRGKPLTSCVAVEAEAPAEAPRKRGVRLPAAAAIAKQALENALAKAGHRTDRDNVPRGVPVVPVELWRREAYAMGISTSEGDAKKKAFARATEALCGLKVAAIYDDVAWLCR